MKSEFRHRVSIVAGLLTLALLAGLTLANPPDPKTGPFQRVPSASPPPAGPASARPAYRQRIRRRTRHAAGRLKVSQDLYPESAA